jgi:hypothetical protein
MTAVEFVLVAQTFAVIFLMWRMKRMQSEIDLLDVTLGAIEREVTRLHSRVSKVV